MPAPVSTLSVKHVAVGVGVSPLSAVIGLSARRLMDGHGSDGAMAPEDAKAHWRALLEGRAEHGGAHAMLLLGLMLVRAGNRGGEEALGMRWLHRAAAMGHVDAQNVVGVAHSRRVLLLALRAARPGSAAPSTDARDDTTLAHVPLGGRCGGARVRSVRPWTCSCLVVEEGH